MAEREPWELSNEESFSKGASGGAWAAAFVSATIALLAASFELGQVVPQLRWLFWPMLFGCTGPLAGWHALKRSGLTVLTTTSCWSASGSPSTRSTAGGIRSSESRRPVA